MKSFTQSVKSAFLSCLKPQTTELPEKKMTSNTNYLVTGAARGLGNALVAHYLAQPNNTVIAAVRDVSNTSSLDSLKVGENSKLIIVGIDSTKETDPAAAVQKLESEYKIEHLDVVVANAGISTDFSPVAKVPFDVVKKHMETNAYGPLYLFQAVIPLLEKSTGTPKFALIGTPMGSITGIESRPFPMAAYGMSKVVGHWMTRKIHQEHPTVTTFTLDPGFVQTDMGNSGARIFGMKEAYTPVADSVKYLTGAIDGATREAASGHFLTIEGGDFAW